MGLVYFMAKYWLCPRELNIEMYEGFQQIVQYVYIRYLHYEMI
jgi:hypothetical protein